MEREFRLCMKCFVRDRLHGMGKAHTEKKELSCKLILQSFTIGPKKLSLSARHIEIQGRKLSFYFCSPNYKQHVPCKNHLIQLELGDFLSSNDLIVVIDLSTVKRRGGRKGGKAGGKGVGLGFGFASLNFQLHPP